MVIEDITDWLREDLLQSQKYNYVSASKVNHKLYEDLERIILWVS